MSPAPAASPSRAHRPSNLAIVLRRYPGRWSPPTIGAASAWPCDLSTERWPEVLDQLECVIGEVVPEEMAGELRRSVVVPASSRSAG